MMEAYLRNLDVEKKFLSDNVYKLIFGCKSTTEVAVEDILENDVLRESYIANLLVDNAGESKAEFASHVRMLAPCIQTVQNFMEKLSICDFIAVYKGLLQWTNNPEVFLHCFELLQSNEPVCDILAMLLCSSHLERSLGDVYVIKGKQCPTLLKDLLVTKELENIFGPCLINILKIVIGPPTSLNLRNLFWHGFVSPGQVPKKFIYFLLLIVASLGRKLESCNIKIADIHHRDFVELKAAIPTLHDGFRNLMSQSVIKDIIYETLFIIPYMKPIWNSAVNAYQQNKYGDCIVLILPQLEHSLRCRYAAENNCEERILTAESENMYTTLSEILQAQQACGDRNNLIDLLGDSFMDLLLDLLVHTGGLRLRDHVSHGEVNLHVIDEDVACYVLFVCFVLCYKWLPSESRLYKNENLNEMYQRALNYESLFHPYSRARKKVSDISNLLMCYIESPRPPQVEIPYLDWHPGMSIAIQEMAADSLISHLEGSNHENICRQLHPFSMLSQSMDNLRKPQHLNRRYHATESVEDYKLKVQADEGILIQLNLILDQCITVCTNIDCCIKIRLEQHFSHLLRSRQRKTFSRMLNSIPAILVGLRVVVLLARNVLECLCKYSGHILDIRLMRNILQYCENLSSFTCINKNRWEEACSLTESFIRNLNKT